MSASMTANALCTLFSILVILSVSCCHCERFFIAVVAATIPALALDLVRFVGGASAADLVALRACVLLAGGPLGSVPTLIGCDCIVLVVFYRAIAMCASSTLVGACSFLIVLMMRWLSMELELGSVW